MYLIHIYIYINKIHLIDIGTEIQNTKYIKLMRKIYFYLIRTFLWFVKNVFIKIMILILYLGKRWFPLKI